MASFFRNRFTLAFALGLFLLIGVLCLGLGYFQFGVPIAAR
jgi:hypothetical protein